MLQDFRARSLEIALSQMGHEHWPGSSFQKQKGESHFTTICLILPIGDKTLFSNVPHSPQVRAVWVQGPHVQPWCCSQDKNDATLKQLRPIGEGDQELEKRLDKKN
jgi:hypothetical protein